MLEYSRAGPSREYLPLLGNEMVRFLRIDQEPQKLVLEFVFLDDLAGWQNGHL